MLREPADYVEMKLRVPKDLRRKLEAEATRQQTSLNAEMMRRFEASFETSLALISKRPRRILPRPPRTFFMSPRE